MQHMFFRIKITQNIILKNMKTKHLLFVSLILLVSCSEKANNKESTSNINLTSFVNPFIGTGGHGHTYPGATLPFGMMQLSPDTRLEGWDGCSGYHYSDNYIYGFSHTHLSGTGISDYGDILLMPTNHIVFNNGSDGAEGYRSTFSHKNEKASPGYYKVSLDDTNIEVSLTVKKRSGIHQYQFPKKGKQIVIIDLEHRDEVLDSKMQLIDSLRISGHRFSKSWATDQRLFFDIEFSRPYKKVTFQQGIQKGKSVKAAFEFDPTESNIIEVKIGISPVDEKGAFKNRQEELTAKSFADVKKEADATWEKQLSKIVVETYNHNDKVNFYSALYHTMLAPNLYQDVDGRYRGMDMEIHKDNEMTYYSVFSLWDTFRATHPLYTIIEQERTNDFIRTFINKFEEGGILPIWDLSANYTDCMIGYHAVPVIADAYLKGIRDYDVSKAFEAVKHSASQDKLGLERYKSLGYVPVENESESVSKTLEYAFDDWAIAMMAQALGATDDYKNFIQRAQYYKNVYNPETKFMRGRLRNKWFAPFDPFEVNFNYTEANAWQYNFYTPQDISGHMALMGGKDAYERLLDQLFTTTSEVTGRDQADITGLIGQYAHGNEPSHHIAYLYNFVNKPYKAQEKIRRILRELYKNEPDGISGNEDCGQMSAWYVFSALGFYPVTPGSNNYIIGSPLVKSATINLENGKTFTINAPNNAENKRYVKKVKLNGELLDKSYLSHGDIIAGGSLDFDMSRQISDWGTSDTSIPSTQINDFIITSPPFITKGDITFENKTTIVLESIQPDAEIYYSIGGTYEKFSKPLTITDNTRLSTYALINGKKSTAVETSFRKINPDIKIQLFTPYINQYNAGGNIALIDGMLGTEDYRTGTWQGYSDEDLNAIVDLGTPQKIKNIALNFLNNQEAWIFYPKRVECYVSTDGKTFSLVGSEDIEIEAQEKSEIKNIRFDDINKDYQYVKIIAKKLGPVPEWHIGNDYDGRAWIFVDEIQIDF